MNYFHNFQNILAIRKTNLLFACQLSIARGNVSHLNLIVRLLSEVRAKRAKGATRARGGTGVAI